MANEQLTELQELRQELDMLRQERDTLKQTLDGVGAYVFVKDTKGRYTYANEKVCEFLGFSGEDILGRTDEDFFDLERSNEFGENDQKAIGTKQIVEAEEQTYVRQI